METLTEVYTLQDLLFDQTVHNIVETFFERETHNPDNLDETLIQFNLRFMELVGQERLLIELYRDAIDDLS
jgi:hypothetical protein